MIIGNFISGNGADKADTATPGPTESTSIAVAVAPRFTVPSFRKI